MNSTRFARCLAFYRYYSERIEHDRVSVSAGYLAYITLISLVPMLTVLLSVLSSFSVFSGAGEMIQSFVIDNFLPAAGDAVSDALNSFVANTGKMTAVGGAFLFVAAMTLISNIDKSLNYIWRVKQKRSWVMSFSMYWMILTLGPILVGASLAITSYVTSIRFLDNVAFTGLVTSALSALPFFLSLLTFTGLYLFVPNMQVRVRDALVGAVLAALLFEASKRGFAFYITQFPSYQLIYGALAAIPILFVWVYLSWFIVLLGAELTATLGEIGCWSQTPNMVESSVFIADQKKEEERDRVNSKGQ